MKIFDRVDAMKTKPAKFLHTVTLANERDVEYFISKVNELEAAYRKTVVLAYDPEGKIIANVPSSNLEDTTDLTMGLTTLRNSLKGLVNLYGKIEANIGLAGINYSKHDNAAQV